MDAIQYRDEKGDDLITFGKKFSILANPLGIIGV